jgi:hypothetical protein
VPQSRSARYGDMNILHPTETRTQTLLSSSQLPYRLRHCDRETSRHGILLVSLKELWESEDLRADRMALKSTLFRLGLKVGNGFPWIQEKSSKRWTAMSAIINFIDP